METPSLNFFWRYSICICHKNVIFETITNFCLKNTVRDDIKNHIIAEKWCNKQIPKLKGKQFKIYRISESLELDQ